MQRDKTGNTASHVAGKQVGATVATLALIRHACRAHSAFRLADVVKDTGLNRSTAFNILRTLVQEGILRFDAESKVYVLTDYLPRLVRGMDESVSDRIAHVHEGMAHVAQLYGINVAHWVVRGDFLILAAVAKSNRDITLTEAEGKTVPLLYGAAGRAVAAARSLPDEELARLMAMLGDDSAAALARLKEDIRRAQSRGWADDGASLQPSVKAVAAAIHDENGRVEGACATLVLNGQFSAEDEEAIALALRRAAQST
ncbi:transcriptional regulator, IclR family [Sphingobium faniae]|nr:transcriptional regulator, IclR family [Sphingobium faniae]